MHRTNRKHDVCFESLEKALAENPETYGHLDLLCGGWPCQNNSIANTRSRSGHDGAKSGLWKELRRLIELFRPKWFVGENVPGLFSVNGGRDFWHVVSDLDSLSYCVAWHVLDSAKFGLAQRRKRVFIIGSFGNIGAAKVFFKPESGCWNDSEVGKTWERGLCLSTRSGERQDPTAETYVTNVVQAGDYRGDSQRGNASFVWQDTHIAEIDANGKGKVAGIPASMDSLRGIVIGNAVSVNVAKWIGERILKYENSTSSD